MSRSYVARSVTWLLTDAGRRQFVPLHGGGRPVRHHLHGAVYARDALFGGQVVAEVARVGARRPVRVGARADVLAPVFLRWRGRTRLLCNNSDDMMVYLVDKHTVFVRISRHPPIQRWVQSISHGIGIKFSKYRAID